MGWKEEIRNGPIQTMSAVVALVGSLVGAGLYFANLSDESGEGELPPPPFVEEKPPLPPLGGELPPIPPFMEGKRPPAAPETDERG